MAAQDHLGPQFYHSTTAQLSPGSMLTPGRPGHAVSSSSHVYMGTSPDRVRSFGIAAATRDNADNYRTYQVQPTGPVEPDPDSNGVRSKHPARVVGMVSEESRPSYTRKDLGGTDDDFEVIG